jgi:hypothetical protein
MRGTTVEVLGLFHRLCTGYGRCSIHYVGGKDVPYHVDDLEIEEVLKGQLDEARTAYNAARQVSDLIKDIRSGLPQPDGDLRIRQAGEALRTALRKYKVALKRFADYAYSGIAPKELLPLD